MEHLGGAVLRVQSGKARDSDLYLILQTIISDKRFREGRTGAIGQLVREIPEQEREELCRAMAQILLTDLKPETENSEPTGTIVNTTPAFARWCAPPPRGTWESTGHITGKYHKEGKTDVARISYYLADLLMALERMWKCAGHLVKAPTIRPIST